MESKRAGHLGLQRVTAGVIGLLCLLGPPDRSLADNETSAARLVEAARSQIGKTVDYDPSYRKLDYPGGDVPLETGVCTDVLIRALREAAGLDLQRLMHEDMKRHWERYPNPWRAAGPDPNIDHRRVLNLRLFFARQGWEIPLTSDPGDYLPGDLVTSTVPAHRPHLTIVSDRRTPVGRPLILHNIGAGTREEDRLFEFPLTGHYRIRFSD